jgi:hypothetical protein
MSQSIPVRSSEGRGPSSGSALMKRTAASARRRASARIVQRLFSMLVPSQTFGRSGRLDERSAIRSGRFVRIWKVCCEATSISIQTWRM